MVVRDQPWLTLPVDRDAGLLVSTEATQLADLAAERIIAAGLAAGRGAARLGSAARLLAAADAVSVAEPVTLARRTPTEDAQFTAHLAVLEGAGESTPAAVNAARSRVLTGVLDALAANDGVLEVELGGGLADAGCTRPAWSGPASPNWCRTGRPH